MSLDLVESFQNLTLAEEVPSDSSFELVGGQERGVQTESRSEDPVSAAEWLAVERLPTLTLTTARENELLAAKDFNTLRFFQFPELSSLEIEQRPLRYNHQEIHWFRIARALRAGISARHKLSGTTRSVVASPRLTEANLWYVVLRAPSRPAGFLTQDSEFYFKHVINKGRFHPQGVSHAFPCLSEVIAYLVGAQVQWPQLVVVEPHNEASQRR